MAIRIIEGTIGSGKTYYAVNHIVKNYFVWDRKKEEWGIQIDVLLISNIDGFKFGLSLDEEIEKAGGMEAFFNVDYLKGYLPRDKKVIIVVDEAQGPRFFHRRFYNPQVFYFFEYSRHLGVDVYLLTQNIGNLAKDLQGLAEYHISVQRRTMSLTGEFSYRFMAGGESFRRRSLRPDKRIFKLYTSMSKGEVEKIPSATRRYILIFLALIVAAALVFYYGFLGVLLPDKEAYAQRSKEVVENVSKDVVPSLPVVHNEPDQDTPVRAAPLQVVNVPAPGTPHEIVAMASPSGSKTGGYVLYRSLDYQGSQRTLRASQLKFDRLCRCNSFSRHTSGDIVDLYRF